MKEVLLMKYSNILTAVTWITISLTGCKVSENVSRSEAGAFTESQIQEDDEQSDVMTSIEADEEPQSSQGVNVSKCAPGPWKWWRDVDGDGYGDPASMITSCDIPDGHVDNNRDCDDDDANVHPSVREDFTDLIDNDCNGAIATTPPLTVNGCRTELDDQSDTDIKLQIIRLNRNYPHNRMSSVRKYVKVETDQPLWLALDTYEEVEWVITESVRGTVKGIVIFNAQKASLRFPPTDQIVYIDDDDERTLIEKAQQATGLKFSNLSTCQYNDEVIEVIDGERFMFTGYYPVCEETMGQGTQPSARIKEVLLSEYSKNCEELMNDEKVCLVTQDYKTEFLGMNSGKTCESELRTSPNNWHLGGSAVWLGHHIYYCGDLNVSLERLNLLDGSIDIAPDIVCHSVLNHEGKLVVYGYDSNAEPIPDDYHLMMYEDFWSAQCAEPLEIVLGPGESSFLLDSSLAGIYADKMYTLKNGELSILQFPSLEIISGPIELEGLLDARHNFPMAVINEREVIVYHLEQSQLITYDTVTGAQVNNLPLLDDDHHPSLTSHIVCSSPKQ